jgi:hypothetical protein
MRKTTITKAKKPVVKTKKTVLSFWSKIALDQQRIIHAKNRT